MNFKLVETLNNLENLAHENKVTKEYSRLHRTLTYSILAPDKNSYVEFKLEDSYLGDDRINVDMKLYTRESTKCINLEKFNEYLKEVA